MSTEGLHTCAAAGAWYHEIESRYRREVGVGSSTIPALEKLLQRVLAAEGVPQADEAYVIPYAGMSTTSAIGFNFETRPAIGFVALGSEMVDTMTLLHEAAHLVERHRSGRWSQNAASKADAHNMVWAGIFIELLRKWGSNEAAYYLQRGWEEAMGFKAFAATKTAAGKPIADMTREEFEALKPNLLYHGTNSLSDLDTLLTQGVRMENVPMNLGRRRYLSGEYAEFGPGAGIGMGLYCSGDVWQASQFGRSVVAIEVRPDEWGLPPEAQGDYKIEWALRDANGVLIHKDIPASRVHLVHRDSRQYATTDAWETAQRQKVSASKSASSDIKITGPHDWGGKTWFTAVVPDGDGWAEIGSLGLRSDGGGFVVDEARVDIGYRRQGVATSLFNAARQRFGGQIRWPGAEEFTEDGDAWSKAMGRPDSGESPGALWIHSKTAMPARNVSRKGVELWDNNDPDSPFDPSGGRWTLFCIEHGHLMNTETLDMANYLRQHPEEWCEVHMAPHEWEQDPNGMYVLKMGSMPWRAQQINPNTGKVIRVVEVISEDGDTVRVRAINPGPLQGQEYDLRLDQIVRSAASTARQAYNAGWRAFESNDPSAAMSRADRRGAPREWYIGFYDNASGLPKYDGLDNPDSDWRKTGAWNDVVQKGKRIRQEGGVRIIANTGTTVTAEVHGDNDVYIAAITRVPGTKQTGMSYCACDWEKYRWARSAPYKRYEGRSCSHILALAYEIQAHEMFGGQITERADMPEWANPFGPRTDRRDGQEPDEQDLIVLDLTSSLSRDAALLALGNIRDALAVARDEVEGETLGRVSALLESTASAEDHLLRGDQPRTAGFKAQVGGQLLDVAGIWDDGRVEVAGAGPMPSSNVLYPTYHPRAGLTAAFIPTSAAKTARLQPVMYHLTDKVDFRLDPKKRPSNNTTLGGDWQPGIFLGGSVETWVNGYGYWRPWVVEFDTTGLRPDDILFEDGHGGETFVKASGYERLRITRVVPLDGLAREQYGEYGWTETEFEEDVFTGEKLPTDYWAQRQQFPSGWRSPDARQMDPSWRDEYAKKVKKLRRTKSNAIASKSAVVKTAAGRGVMVAFSPSRQVSEALSNLAADHGLDAEPPEEIHLTLAYCGKANEVPDKEAFLGAVRAWAAQHSPFRGVISGIGTWVSDDGHVLWASPDVPGISAARASLVEALSIAGTPARTNHDFNPHITLAYSDEPFTTLPDITPLVGTEMNFTTVVAAYDGEWVHIDLVGTSGETTAIETVGAKKTGMAWTMSLDGARYDIWISPDGLVGQVNQAMGSVRSLVLKVVIDHTGKVDPERSFFDARRCPDVVAEALVHNLDAMSPGVSIRAALGRDASKTASTKISNAEEEVVAIGAINSWVDKNDVEFAGLVIKAADTGRVLMTQRTPYHGDDEDVRGKWEFPGGHLDDHEDAVDGAMREFFEETGLVLPDEAEVRDHLVNGKYVGVVVVVPNEAWTTDAQLLDLETMGIGWFTLEEAIALGRPETADTVDEQIIMEAIRESRYLTVDDARGAYREAYGDGDANDVMREVYAQQEAIAEAALLEDPEPVFEGDDPGVVYGSEVDGDGEMASMPSAGASTFPSGLPMLAHLAPDAPNPPHFAPPGGSGGDDGVNIAAAAKEFLAKQSVKVFSPAEQQALIDEGAHAHVGAANTDRLDLTGTFYEDAAGTSGAPINDDEILW